MVPQGEARSDLHTLPTASRLDAIRGLFGPEVAASLLPVELTGGSGDVSEAVPLDGPMGFAAQVRTAGSSASSVLEGLAKAQPLLLLRRHTPSQSWCMDIGGGSPVNALCFGPCGFLQTHLRAGHCQLACVQL